MSVYHYPFYVKTRDCEDCCNQHCATNNQNKIFAVSVVRFNCEAKILFVKCLYNNEQQLSSNKVRLE